MQGICYTGNVWNIKHGIMRRPASREPLVPRHGGPQRGDGTSTPTLQVTRRRRCYQRSGSEEATWQNGNQQECGLRAKGQKESLEVMRKVKKYPSSLFFSCSNLLPVPLARPSWGPCDILALGYATIGVLSSLIKGLLSRRRSRSGFAANKFCLAQELYPRIKQHHSLWSS